MISNEDPRLRHTRALFVLALFILVAGQLLPKSPGSSEAGWTLWPRIVEDVADLFRGRGLYRRLLPDGLSIISVILIASAPVFMSAFTRSPALLWTARVLAVATWATWLYIARFSGYLDGGQNCILIALLILIAGLVRLPAQQVPAVA